MGQGPYGNKINAGLGDGSNRAQGNATTGFCFRALSHQRHGLAEVLQAHIVEQDNIRTGLHRLLNLFDAVSFNLDGKLWVLLSRTRDGCSDGVWPRLAQSRSE